MILPAPAQELEYPHVVNMALLTCREVEQYPIPRALLVIGWIRGYYDGLKHETEVDVPQFLEDADRVISLCRDNESTALMTVVEQALRPDRP